MRLLRLSCVLVCIAPAAMAAEVPVLSCQLEPARRIDVAMPASGILAEMPSRRGDVVKQGQVLARLESSEQEAEVEALKQQAGSDAQIDLATAQLAALQAQAQSQGAVTGAATPGGQPPAPAAGGAGPAQAAKPSSGAAQGGGDTTNAAPVAAAQSQAQAQAAGDPVLAARIAEAEAAVAAARDAQDHAKLKLAEAQAELDLRKLRAPADGIVLSRDHDAGEYVTPDEPVLTLVSTSTLHAELTLPADAYRAVTLGQKVSISGRQPVLPAPAQPSTATAATSAPATPPAPPAPADTPRTGTIAAIDPEVDPATGQFGVRVLVDNADGGLIAGEPCDARISGD